MGTLPTEMVAGKYYSIYDAYYKQVDPTNKGSVGAMDAANFLKTSGLTHDVLSKIWDLADSNAKGFLTRSGFFVALKLVALVQAGKEPTTANLSLDVPPPRMGDAIPNSNKVPPVNKIAAAGESEWAMKPTEKIKYDQLFDSLNPSNGFIPGSKVKGLLMDSKLPLDTLGKIWDLADMDKDGALDRHEFSVAMHLVYKALEKYAIPSSLPPELLPPGKKKDSISLVSGSIQVLPAVPPAVPNGVQSLTSTPLVPPASKPLIPAGPTPPLIPPISTAPLIPPISSSPIPSMGPPLIPSMKPNSVPIKPLTPPTQNAPSIPVAAAFPIDNFVTTEEPWVISKEEKIKYDALFEQADLDRDGFVNGHEIKDVFLKSGVAQPVLAHIWSLCDTAEQGKLNNEQFALALWLISRKLKGIEPPPKLTPEMIPPSCRKKSENTTNEPTVFTSPEVTRLTKEIEELTKEKLALETDITQREADIKIKTGEVKSLQGELDALVATLKQLENQKGEAAKRINDLKTQTAELESKIDDIKSELELEQIEVDKLRHQAEEQEKTLKQQESELNKKKQELDTLKKEEAALKKQREDLKNEIANVNKTAGETDELIVEIKEKLIELDDIQRQLKEAISHLDNVLESKNLTSLSEVYLQVEPKFRGESYSTLFSKIFKITGQNAADPFSNSEVDFSKTDSFASDPFCDGNAFKSDPFAGKDPFQSNTTANTVGFDSDPFASFNSGSKKPDPFDASPNPAATNAQTNEQDPFGGDPFAILHAPPKPGSNLPSPSSAPRAESPSPALPPKKSKQPPPRPAPPRPAPLSLPSGFDTDFADFSVLSHKPSGFSSTTSVKSDHSSKNDPFRDYRYDDPFEMADCSAPFRGASAPPMMDYKSAAFDPFMSTNGVSKSSTPVSSPLPPEDQQLAWATMESVRSEKERRKRAEQEKADFKLALKLSKQEGKKKSFRSKITLK